MLKRGGSVFYAEARRLPVFCRSMAALCSTPKRGGFLYSAEARRLCVLRRSAAASCILPKHGGSVFYAEARRLPDWKRAAAPLRTVTVAADFAHGRRRLLGAGLPPSSNQEAAALQHRTQSRRASAEYRKPPRFGIEHRAAALRRRTQEAAALQHGNRKPPRFSRMQKAATLRNPQQTREPKFAGFPLRPPPRPARHTFPLTPCPTKPKRPPSSSKT